MRLIKCHIENFGKLSDFDYDFKDNLNLIFGNNGWGKSTFAAFLKVMFYGFDNDARRIPDKERNRYKPWQGGVYGGSITFKVGDKLYILTRTFDPSKPANDEMELRDADTNLVSNDFSKNIGEELFSIDAESFKKSIYIYQGNCVSAATDGINAKMGNLSDTTDDISRFEAAKSILGEYLNTHSLTRATGSLTKTKKYLDELRQMFRGIDTIEKSIESENCQIKELELRKKDELSKLDQLQKKQAEVSEYKDIQTKKTTLLSLEEEVSKRQKDFEEAKSAFSHGVPTENEAMSAFKLAEEYEASLNKLEGLDFAKQDRQRFEELKEEYGEDLPTIEAIKEVQKEWTERKNKVSKADSIQNKIDSLELIGTGNSSAESKGNSGLTILGIVILLAGVAMFILGNMGMLSGSFGMIGAVVAMAGIILSVAGMLSKGKPKEVSNPSLDKIQALEDELEKIDEEIDAIDIRVSDFLNRYNRDFEEAQIDNDLFELRSLVSDYERIKESASKFDDVALVCSNQKRELEEYAYKWGIPVPNHLLNIFRQIRVDYTEYLRSYRELERAMEAYRNFVEANGGKESLELLKGKEAPKDESVVGLNEEITACNISISELDKLLQDAKTHLAKNMERIDDLKEKKNEFEAGTVEYKKNKAKYELVKKTNELLNEAQNTFLLKYSAPLKEAFDKYYNIVTSNSNDIYIDVKSNVTKMEQGAQRELFFLSSGYQDLIGICLRLAFVDVMYKDEKPFIILDDPFANLDGEKILKAKELIEQVSKEYQVIYFTCHKELTLN